MKKHTIPELGKQQFNERAGTERCDHYFRLLLNFTFSKVNDRFTAEEIVQELFISIRKQRHINTIRVSRAYLFASPKNLIISHYCKAEVLMNFAEAKADLVR